MIIAQREASAGMKRARLQLKISGGWECTKCGQFFKGQREGKAHIQRCSNMPPVHSDGLGPAAAAAAAAAAPPPAPDLDGDCSSDAGGLDSFFGAGSDDAGDPAGSSQEGEGMSCSFQARSDSTI